MKESISSLDLHYLLREIKLIVNGRIDKVYQDQDVFVLTMHVPRDGRKLLRILPNMIYLTEHKETFPTTPPGFCKFLRKNLANDVIVEVLQHQFERILFIKFKSDKTLVIELFAGGNVLLLDEKNKILGAFQNNKFKDRTIRGGVEYELPPSQINLMDLSFEKFKEIITTSNLESIVKILAIELSFGGLYAEYLCSTSGIDKDKKGFSEAILKKLYNSINAVLEKELSPFVLNNEIFPFDMPGLDVSEGTKFESYSKAIDSVFSKKIKVSNENEQLKEKSSQIARVEKVIEQQKQTIKGLEISAEENQQKGEALYLNYDKIKTILHEFNLIKSKMSLEELKEYLKKSKVIKKITNESITIKL